MAQRKAWQFNFLDPPFSSPLSSSTHPLPLHLFSCTEPHPLSHLKQPHHENLLDGAELTARKIERIKKY